MYEWSSYNKITLCRNSNNNRISFSFLAHYRPSGRSKVCRYLGDSRPESKTIYAARLHPHSFGLCGFRKLCRKLWLFFHQHLVEQRTPDVTALLQCALRGLTSYLIWTLPIINMWTQFIWQIVGFCFVAEFVFYSADHKAEGLIFLFFLQTMQWNINPLAQLLGVWVPVSLTTAVWKNTFNNLKQTLSLKTLSQQEKHRYK